MRSNIYGQVYTLKTCFVFSRVVLVFLKQKTKKTQGCFGFGPKTKKLEENKKNKKNSREPKNQKKTNSGENLGFGYFLFFWFSRGFFHFLVFLEFFWFFIRKPNKSQGFFGFGPETKKTSRKPKNKKKNKILGRILGLAFFFWFFLVFLEFFCFFCQKTK